MAGSFGKGHGGEVSIDADTILLAGEKASISNSAFNAGNSGALSITTNNFKLHNGATLSATSNGSGDSGDVIINAHNGNILLSEAHIFNTGHANSTGDLGSIIINANNLQILENAGIAGTAQGGSNSERIIQINSQSLTISGEASSINTGTLSTLFSLENPINLSNNDTVNATPIELNISGHLILRDGAAISTNTTTNGNAGDISINAGSIELSKALVFSDALSSVSDTQQDVSRTGNAGDISIITQSLDLKNGSLITSNTRTAGHGGNITVDANLVFLSGSRPTTNNLKLYSKISTETYSQDNNAGDAGNITLDNVEYLDIQGGTTINADTTGAGLGGELTIDAKSIFLSSSSLEGIQSSISASTYSSGNAGNVTLNNVEQLVIKGGRIGVKTTGTGSGGELVIDAKSISLSGEGSNFKSGLIASTNSIDDNAGDAGNITVTSEQIDISSEGEININTTGAGKGGELIINAGSINISGKNTPYLTGIFVLADSTELNAGDTGDAGKATINVGHLNISDTAKINASTYGNGNGGDLTINAQSITIKGNMTDDFTGIITQANWSKGNIEYRGNAGDLTINVTDTLDLQNGATISTSTYGIGEAGKLTITANDILLNSSILKSSSNIETVNPLESSEMAKSGAVNITANNSLNLENNSSISVATTRANAGGITVVSGNDLNIRNSNITTSVANGEGNGGNITVNSPIVSLNNSQIVAQAKQGSGGDIAVSGFLFQSPESIVSASSELSKDGELNLDPETSISGSIAVLPKSFLNASEQLNDRCNNRSGKSTNSFVVKGKGGIPLSPDKPVSSDFMDFLPTTISSHNVSKNKNNHQVNNYQLPSLSVDCVLSSNAGK